MNFLIKNKIIILNQLQILIYQNQNNNYQEADFLKYDNNYIYFLNNNVLNIFDMNNNYLIKSLSFNDFYCYQLLINDNDIILMGSKLKNIILYLEGKYIMKKKILLYISLIKSILISRELLYFINQYF